MYFHCQNDILNSQNCSCKNDKIKGKTINIHTKYRILCINETIYSAIRRKTKKYEKIGRNLRKSVDNSKDMQYNLIIQKKFT